MCWSLTSRRIYYRPTKKVRRATLSGLAHGSSHGSRWLVLTNSPEMVTVLKAGAAFASHMITPDLPHA